MRRRWRYTDDQGRKYVLPERRGILSKWGRALGAPRNTAHGDMIALLVAVVCSVLAAALMIFWK